VYFDFEFGGVSIESRGSTSTGWSNNGYPVVLLG